MNLKKNILFIVVRKDNIINKQDIFVIIIKKGVMN